MSRLDEVIGYIELWTLVAVLVIALLLMPLWVIYEL